MMGLVLDGELAELALMLKCFGTFEALRALKGIGADADVVIVDMVVEVDVVLDVDARWLTSM